MSELKQCPFCGNEDINVIDDMGDGYYQVICSVIRNGCGAATGYHQDKKQAINAWNRRVNNATD